RILALPEWSFELVLGVWHRLLQRRSALVLEHWLEAFSLPLLTLKKQGHLASLNR
ncbi:hypothetical protein TIFTF001_045997, partial [Ficus carica]